MAEKEEKKDVGAGIAPSQAGKFNPKWLEGPYIDSKGNVHKGPIPFTGADEKLIEKNGRKTLHPTRFERPATADDLLSWKDYGDKVVIATKDGKKYQIKK